MNDANHEQTCPIDVRARIEAVVGAVTWISDHEGIVVCPGRALHTKPNGARDCMLYLDHVPTLKCFHASCSEAVESKSRELRRALAGEDVQVTPHRATEEEKQRRAEALRRRGIKIRASLARDQILKEWAWPYASILAESPVKLDDNAASHWRALVELFNDGDGIWMGSLYSSGKPEHADRFRRKERWLEEPLAPGQFTCPAVFKDGSSTRSNDNILARRFLVVESDELTKDQVGSIFRWLHEKVGLKLRAIVDTAGKSLHGWFDFPAEAVLEDLKLVLPGLGCDPKLFTASQPVRLPGAIRDGKYQRLVWLGGRAQ